MNKKLIFYIGCTALISAGLGYLGGLSQAGQPNGGVQATDNTPSANVRSPRFGESGQLSSMGKKNMSQDKPFFDKSDIDSLVRYYARMSPERIEEEVSKLYGVDFNSDLDFNKVMSLFYLSHRWGKIAPKQALLKLKSIGKMAPLCILMTMQGWAETDPEAATAHLLENKQDFPRDKEILSQIAAGFGKNSPSQALKWLSTLSDDNRKSVLPSLMARIAETHLDQLPDKLAQLTPQDLKDDNLCEDIAEVWSKSDWTAAEAWIKTLPEPQRSSAMSSALGQLVLTDPEAATAQFNNLDPQVKNFTALAIAKSLVNRSSLEAVTWLVKNTQEEAIPSILDDALGYTDQVRSPQLAEYAAQLPGGKTKDALLRTIVEKTTYLYGDTSVDFERTMNMAKQIGDEKVRMAGIKRTLSHGVYTNPELTLQWLDKSDLPSDLKQKYRDIHEQRMKEKKQ